MRVMIVMSMTFVEMQSENQQESAHKIELTVSVLKIMPFSNSLSHQVVVDSVLESTEDYDRPGELQVDFLHGFVCQHHGYAVVGQMGIATSAKKIKLKETFPDILEPGFEMSTKCQVTNITP